MKVDIVHQRDLILKKDFMCHKCLKTMEEVHQEKHVVAERLIIPETLVTQSELVPIQITNPSKAVAHNHVPFYNLEPSLRFHNEPSGVDNVYYSSFVIGDLCGKAELSDTQMEVLHVKNGVQSFKESTSLITLLCVHQMFDQFLMMFCCKDETEEM